MPTSYSTPGTDPDEHFVLVPPTEDEILSRAISHYGEPAQVLKCIEELAELSNDLLKSLETHDEVAQIWLDRLKDLSAEAAVIARHRVPRPKVVRKYTSYGIISELADVDITTSQMRKMFTTPDEFEKAKQAKLSRLAKRMNRGDSQ